MATRRRRPIAVLLLAPALAACGQILGIGDVELAPTDASVSTAGGDGGGTASGDGAGTVNPESSTTGSDDSGTPDDHAAPPPNDAGTDGASSDADATTGVCAEGQTRCSGNYAVEVCAANEQWGAATDCPLTTPYCNAGQCGICAAGATSCSDNGIQTCDGGAWGAPVACANSACSNGTCTGDCSPSSTQCSPDAATTPQTCNTNGTWQNGAACAYVCEDGGCTGSCTPGALACSGQQPQKCSASGTWQNNGSSCPILCTSGVCTGSCSPGAATCSGLQPQRCTDAGAWLNNGGACPYVCDAGGCSGVCTPSSETCSGKTPETCNAGGEWQNGTPCTYVCDAGNCTGVCSPGAKECVGNGYVACSGAGQWGTTPTPCTASACTDGGVCTGVCVPGSTECSGSSNGYVTCSTSGAWGTTITPCVSSACSSGSCIGSCVPGTMQCNAANTGIETCNSSGAWGLASPCTSGETCSNGVCGCPSGDTLCSTTCTNTQTDSLNCGTCGHSCLGEACSGGLCTPDSIAALYGGTFSFEFGVGIDSSNIYFTTGSDGRIAVCPLTGCTVTNPSGGATIPTYIYTGPSGANLGQMLYDVTAGVIYVTDQDNGVLYSVTTAGSLNWTISGRSSPQYMSTDGTNLYWGETGGLEAVPVGGGLKPVTTVYSSGTSQVYGVWYDPTSTDLFGTISSEPGDVIECSGVEEIFNPSCTLGTSSTIYGPLMVQVVGSTIFFTANGQTNGTGGGLFSAPISNPSQITAMATGSAYSNTLGLAADTSNVYFASWTNGIYRCAVGGCGGTATKIVATTDQIFGMAVDSQYIYWGTTEKVMRVAK